MKSNKLYPIPRVEKESREIAKILSHLYASSDGELTAIHQYIYETIVLEEVEITKILRDIAITEMHHLQLLGKTISLLGCIPIFADTNYNTTDYWNSDFVYYDIDLKTILEINIEREKISIYNYQMVLKVIDDKYIKELLERILEDEYYHLKIFKELLENTSI